MEHSPHMGPLKDTFGSNPTFTSCFRGFPIKHHKAAFWEWCVLEGTLESFLVCWPPLNCELNRFLCLSSLGSWKQVRSPESSLQVALFPIGQLGGVSPFGWDPENSVFVLCGFPVKSIRKGYRVPSTNRSNWCQLFIVL